MEVVYGTRSKDASNDGVRQAEFGKATNGTLVATAKRSFSPAVSLVHGSIFLFAWGILRKSFRNDAANARRNGSPVFGKFGFPRFASEQPVRNRSALGSSDRSIAEGRQHVGVR